MQCSILKPREMRYHYHLSDIAKHHGVFVDHLLCYIIEKYEMKMKVISFRVSDNASSRQYNNKHSSGLFQQLADESGLGIIVPMALHAMLKERLIKYRALE